MDLGRMAVFVDPTGAVFGVWQPKAFAGADLVNEPVSLTWNEVHTRDPDTDKAFYGSVFGWTAGKPGFEGAPDTYTVWQLDGKNVGGMMEMVEGMFPPEHAAALERLLRRRRCRRHGRQGARGRRHGRRRADGHADRPLRRARSTRRALVHDHAACGRLVIRAARSPHAPRLLTARTSQPVRWSLTKPIACMKA